MKKTKLKVIGIIVFCFTLIFGVFPPSPIIANELQSSAELMNPSFELGLVDGEIQGWSVDEATAAYGSVELSNKYARTGSNSLLFWDKTAGAQPVGHFRVLSNAIAAAADEDVTFSIYVYKENATDQSHGIQPVIHYYNEAGVQVKNNDFVNYGKDAVTTGEWNKLTVTGKAPVGTAYIKVGLYSGFPSLTKLYVDDAVIIIGEEDTTPPDDIKTELTNPGFEDDLVDGSIPGWTIRHGTGEMSLSTDIFKSGKRSLYFNDNSPTNGFRVMGDKLAVTPGDTILVTSNVYVISQSHNIVSEIYYYNARNEQVGSDLTLFSSVSLGTEKWSTMRLMSAVPPKAVYARIALYSGDPSLTEAYFDDISYTILEPETPLDREYEDPVNLGEKVYVNLGQAGAVQTNANGENEAYFVTNGKPGTFFVVDGETGKLKFQEVIPSTIATWAMTIDDNKNVYFAGTEDGILYRYLPVEKKIEKLGFNQTDNWVWDLEAIGDKVYGGTFNNLTDGKVFEYNITTGEFRNYGVIDKGQNYVRGIAVDDQYIYAALGATAKLFKIDRVTGEKTEILMPGYSGTTGIMADVYVQRGKLFVSVSTTNVVVMDLETLEVEASFQQSAMISEPAPYDSNLIYFKYLTKFYQYDIAAKETSEVALPFPVPDTGRVKDYAWITMDGGEKAGETVLAMITQYGEYILIDPRDKWMQFIELEIDAQPVNIQSMERGFDGRIYLGGYQRGMSIYNPFTSNIDVSISSFAQPEGIGFLNDKVYYGTYVSAIMYSYDPTKEVELNINPKLEFDAQNQDRPFVITSGDDKLFVGTVADYGYLEGALLIYDEPTDTWTQHDGVVENQSMMGLAYKDGLLYGSTSVWGGLGVDPSEPEAKMFIWDVAQGKKIDEFTLDDLLIDETPRMIGGLKFGPDGLLWGVVDGTIFAMDVETKSIVKSKMIQPSLYNSSKVLPYKLEFAPDGLLYTTLSRKLFAIEPQNLQYKMVSGSFVNIMTLGIDGSIYFAPEAGTSLARIAVPQTDATLAALTIEGVAVEQFSPGVLNYEVEGSSDAVVDAVPTQSGATVTVEAGDNQTLIHVVGTDGVSKLDYVINWVKKEVVDVTLIRNKLKDYRTSGELVHSLAKQLENSVYQAEHHNSKGQKKQAIKSLEDFLKHLNNKAHQEKISPEAKEKLTAYAQSLIAEWQEK
ncbi:FIMAH domain-containing protein [Pseudogracilibacillus auburnensis]|uniref:FIMAH domain-containing protein n=1 Tax=Pseudogracilibacillus auburnensis TaxID=1494959 RepID=UPI001A9755F6|nr:hypothetical protein [Pseudogracilibacillus auburnensis]MBO1005319.1 hypothetical protein [Pseudogracilibacillus auburnensis]